MSEAKSNSETFDINAPFKIDLSNAVGTRRDNTLLAKMGFSDPDRQNPLHDLACQYLAQPDVVQRMFDCALKGISFEFYEKGINVSPEFHIAKGDGQYRTTVGFVDLFLEALIYHHHIQPDDSVFKETKRVGIIVEIKTGGTSASDALRQLNVYREFIYAQFYSDPIICAILVTTYDLTEPDIEMLRRGHVLHLQLGKAFADYCQQCREAPRAASPEI